MARSGSQALEPTAVSLGWSHDGRGLTDDGEKYSIVNVNTSMTSVTTEYIVSSTLMIYDVGLIDSGEYDCVVNVVIVIAGTDRAETVTVSEGRKLFVLGKLSCMLSDVWFGLSDSPAYSKKPAKW